MDTKTIITQEDDRFAEDTSSHFHYESSCVDKIKIAYHPLRNRGFTPLSRNITYCSYYWKTNNQKRDRQSVKFRSS